MKIIISFLLFLSLFGESLLLSQYLTKYKFSYNIDITFPPIDDKEVKSQLVEIFSPFEAFQCNYGINIKRIILMFKNDNITNIVKINTNNKLSEIWVRVIKIKNIIPRCNGLNADVMITNDTWSQTLSMNSLGVLHDSNQFLYYNTSFKYHVYGIPVYPAGNMNTWSSDYLNIRANKSEIVFNAINKSIENEYLEKNADLLHATDLISGQFNFTMASRMIRDYLVIVVAYGSNNLSYQYPPIYINGCLTLPNRESQCGFFTISYPMYLIFGCAIIFVALALKSEFIHIFCCSLIVAMIIVALLWKWISYNEGLYDVLKIVIPITLPIFAILCASFWLLNTEEYTRSRMFFTALVISIIILSIIWFPPIRFIPLKSVIYFVVISGTVTLILFLLLYFCNHLTLTVGSLFIGGVIMSVSLSLSNINASIIPYIFIDLYTTITYAYPNWIYYSPVLKDDLFIFILCPVLTVFFGLTRYCVFKSKLRKEEKKYKLNIITTPTPTPRTDNYGAIKVPAPNITNMEYNIIMIEQNNQPINYQPPQQQFVLAMLPEPSPPTYEICYTRQEVTMTATAPYCYNGPYNDKF